MAARARVEPTTLRFKTIDSTNAPLRPTTLSIGNLHDSLRRSAENSRHFPPLKLFDSLTTGVG